MKLFEISDKAKKKLQAVQWTQWRKSVRDAISGGPLDRRRLKGGGELGYWGGSFDKETSTLDLQFMIRNLHINSAIADFRRMGILSDDDDDVDDSAVSQKLAKIKSKDDKIANKITQEIFEIIEKLKQIGFLHEIEIEFQRQIIIRTGVQAEYGNEDKNDNPPPTRKFDAKTISLEDLSDIELRRLQRAIFHFRFKFTPPFSEIAAKEIKPGYYY